MKLYPEDESGPLSTKKPVVVESYDEVVISEPSEAFFARVQHHPALIVPRLPADFTLPPGKVFIIALVSKGFATLYTMKLFLLYIFCFAQLLFKMLLLYVFIQCLRRILTTGTEVTQKIIIP